MLRDSINRYVATKRAMGYKYRIQNCLLQLYATFAEQRGDEHVNCQAVLDWAGLAPSLAQKRNRLLTIRRFSIEVKSEDSRHEIPPADAFGRRLARRKIRHLYSSNDIQQLLGAASQLKPRESIRPKTFTTLFSLLAISGLRVSEAIALNIGDVTPDGLIINATKFRKDRLVPLHPSAYDALQHYMAKRLSLFPVESNSSLFVDVNGSKLTYDSVYRIFLRLMRSLGLRGEPGKSGLCLHDFRHSFAVKSLEQCIGSRAEISQHMTSLSTYLGHAHISDTYWYLQATPTLLNQIAIAQETCFRSEAND